MNPSCFLYSDSVCLEQKGNKLKSDNVLFCLRQLLHLLHSLSADQIHADCEYFNVITTRILSALPVVHLWFCSLWNRFDSSLFSRWPWRSRPLRTSNYSVGLDWSCLCHCLAACTVFLQRNIPPTPPPSAWNAIAWHDIKRNGNPNEACLKKAKKKSILSEAMKTDLLHRDSARQTIPFWKATSFHIDVCVEHLRGMSRGGGGRYSRLSLCSWDDKARRITSEHHK